MELVSGPLFKDSSLKAYYRLESDGFDSSGNGLNMTVTTGSPSYSTGVYGNGIYLDPGATPDSLSIASDLGITGGACSIAFWVKLSSDIASGAINFCQQNDGGTVVGNCVSYEYNAGTRRLFFRRSKWNIAHQGPTYNVALGTGWNHIVYTYDATNVRGYLNGALVAGPTAASGNGTGVLSDGFGLAASTVGVVGIVMQDDIAIFNDALSLSEIEQLYRGNPNFFQMF